MAYPYSQTDYPFPNQPWYLDVRDWGATGDQSIPDNGEIQDALDAAESYGGGIVYFPPGIYVIQDTIKLPSKVYIKGVAGTTYNDIDTNPSIFLGKVNTIIRLIDNAPDGMSMIEPKTPGDFHSAGIENLILDGNWDPLVGQGSGQRGINIIDSADPQQRSQTQFRNVLIYRVNGVGFYGGVGQQELFLDWVTVFDCESDGFVLRGEDIKGTRVASGKNKGVGIKFPGSGSEAVGSGASRFIDVDSWSNNVGMEISDTMGFVFFHLQFDRNSQNALRIYSTNPQPPGFTPGNIRIYRGRFSQNSFMSPGGFSDIRLEPNAAGYAPYDLALIGCEFHGSSGADRPRYAIEDVSPFPRRAIVMGGFVALDNYLDGFSNKPQAIRDCFNYNTGDILTEAEIHYNWDNQDYLIGLGDGFVGIAANLGERKVILPSLSAIPTGRLYYVCKTEGSGNSVIVSAQEGESFNENGSVELTGLRETYMIIHAGTAWLGIKIS